MGASATAAAAVRSVPAACRLRMDAWCNVPANNPSKEHNVDCRPQVQSFFALDAQASSAYSRDSGPRLRCYGASTLNPNHTRYEGVGKCYSSETAQLEWQLCACLHGNSTAICGERPPPRGFPPRPSPRPLPPGPAVTSTPLFVPCEDNRTGFRIPALLAVGNTTLYAFAEARTGNGDGDFARRPCPGDNRTAIVFKTSEDGGRSWSGITDICPDGTGETGYLLGSRTPGCRKFVNKSTLWSPESNHFHAHVKHLVYGCKLMQ